jgi:hypothetical protein
VVLNIRGGNGAGTDQDGGAMTVRSGQGTGTGADGTIVFETAPPAAATGSSLNAHQEAVRIEGIEISGNQFSRVGIGNPTTVDSVLHVNAEIASLEADIVRLEGVTSDLITRHFSDGGGGTDYIWEVGLDRASTAWTAGDFIFATVAGYGDDERRHWLSQNGSFSSLDALNQGVDDVNLHDQVGYTQTTNATPTTVAIVDPPANDRTALAVILVQGQISTGGTADAAGYVVEVIARRSGGTTTVVGSIVRPVGEDNAAWDVTVTSAGLVQATGAAATTINWKATTLVQSNHISTATH